MSGSSSGARRSSGRRDQAAPADQATTAVAVFDPKVASRDLVAAVEQRKPQLAALLQVDVETERGRMMLDRFVTVALHAATSRPDLLRATKESLVESIRDAAMLGLEPVGATGDGAIVVYDEKVKREVPSRSGNGMIVVEERIPTARFQPMYRGLLKLARRSDEIAHIDAHVVYQGDEISLDLGSSPKVVHYPVLDGAKRGNVVGAYAVAELRNGRRYVEWMTYADIEAVRKSSRAKDQGPWVSFWAEMARKTVLRRLLKRLPLETLAEHAYRLENEAEERAVAPMLEAGAEPTDARRRLRARMGAADPAETPSGDQDPGEAPRSGSGTDEEAGEGDPAVLGDPGRADDPAAADDVVEGDARELPADDAKRCRSVSPLTEDGPRCELEAGHGGPHRSGEKEAWL